MTTPGRLVKGYFTKDCARRSSLMAEYCDRLGDLVLRHRATTALGAAKVDAELASRAKTEFIAKMSHELRTPLNAIIGFSEVLGTSGTATATPEQVPEYAKYIEDSARHLLSIVNNILELSKIQSGRVALSLELVDLEEVLSSCLTLFQDSAKSNQIEIHQEVWPELPLVEADLVKVRQIFINLISNAVKFTPAGGRVTITINRQDDDCVRLIVRDSGIGMTPEDLDVALKPFGQADGSIQRQYEGSGLGLPIVQALAAMHRGSVHVHSEPNRGTTVTICLPVSAAARAKMSMPPTPEPFPQPDANNDAFQLGV